MLSDKIKTKEKILYDFIYMNFRIGKTNQSVPKPGDEQGLTRKEYNRTFRSKENANIMQSDAFLICTLKMAIFIFNCLTEVEILYSSPFINLQLNNFQ